MVDVGDKPATDRRAVARAVVRMTPADGGRRSPAGDAPKGDVLGTARIAGIQAAKRTGELIPLCHPLGARPRRRRRRGRRRRRHGDAHRRGARHRAHGRRDGGDDRRRGRRADGLRHGQGPRARRRRSARSRCSRSPAARSGDLARATASLSAPDAHRRPDDLDVRRAAARPRTSPGPLLAHLAEEAGADVEAMEVVPDDFPLIEDRLHHYVDDEFAFVFTTGGTGLTPDDVTPEATRAVIEREAPGHRRGDARASLRAHADGDARRAASSGVAHRTLIVNFPGSPKAIERALRASSRRCSRHAAETLAREGGATPAAIELDGPDAPLRRARRARGRHAGGRRPGATLVVFGPNGAGKSTLLRVLATLLRPHARRACASSAARCPATAGRCAAASACSATSRSLYRDLTAPREPALPRAPARRRRRARRGAARARRPAPARRRPRPHLLARDGAAARRSPAPSCTTPTLLLLDEPRANLDPAAAELVEPLIGARVAGARASSRATTPPAGWPRPTSRSACAAGAPRCSRGRRAARDRADR